jgi:LPXTG-motif cell wall-anchored protein
MATLSFFAVVAALVAVMTPSPASAVTYDKLTYLTFTAPVQVPGTTLHAGTYRFALTNPESYRSVVHVLSGDASTVHAMFHTLPDNRASVTEEAVVTFKETPVGVPPAVKSLFYGGEHRGYEFVYPAGGPVMIAEALPQPEITYTPIPVPAFEVFAEPEPAAAAEPVAVAEPAAVAEQAPVPEPAASPVELPRTASPLPLVVVGGLTSLVAGLGLGRLRRRRN